MTHVAAKSELPRLWGFDHAHEAIGSDTFALGVQIQRLKLAKVSRGIDHEQQMLDMARTLSGYRRELQFFRTTYASIDLLVSGVRSVIQQMILNYYLRPEVDGERDDQWLGLSEELDGLLKAHANTSALAEQDWMKLSEQNMRIDHSRWF